MVKNPIHKTITGCHLRRNGPSSPIKNWTYTCPICDNTDRPNSYYNWYAKSPTRKVAKDRLHAHMKKEHGGLVDGCS